MAKRTSTVNVAAARDRMPRKPYERELFRLQAELVKAQEWVRAEGTQYYVPDHAASLAG